MSAAQQQPKPSGVWLTIKPFVNGGLSGMAATCIIQPIDMIKVRKQLGAQGSAVSAGEDCSLAQTLYKQAVSLKDLSTFERGCAAIKGWVYTCLMLGDASLCDGLHAACADLHWHPDRQE
jgi:hypothetical protein